MFDRRFGLSKDGVIARQFMLGVVQTADGLPIHHEALEAHLAGCAFRPIVIGGFGIVTMDFGRP